jgi:hypothetical protein
MAQKTHRGQHEPCINGFAAYFKGLTEIFGKAIDHGENLADLTDD